MTKKKKKSTCYLHLLLCRFKVCRNTQKPFPFLPLYPVRLIALGLGESRSAQMKQLENTRSSIWLCKILPFYQRKITKHRPFLNDFISRRAKNLVGLTSECNFGNANWQKHGNVQYWTADSIFSFLFSCSFHFRFGNWMCSFHSLVRYSWVFNDRAKVLELKLQLMILLNNKKNYLLLLLIYIDC